MNTTLIKIFWSIRTIVLIFTLYAFISCDATVNNSNEGTFENYYLQRKQSNKVQPIQDSLTVSNPLFSKFYSKEDI